MSLPAQSAAPIAQTAALVRELLRRTLSGALIVVVTLTALYAGGWLLGALLMALAAGGAYELYRLAERHGVRPFVLGGCAAAATLVLIALLRPTLEDAAPLLWLLTIGLVLLAAAAVVWRRDPSAQPFAVIGTTVAGALWPGGSLLFLLFLRSLPADLARGPPALLAGPALALLPILLCWTSDSAAYLIGRAWGRHKLSPRISPGKTWEGAIAGGLSAVVVGAIYSALVLQAWLQLPLGWPAGVACGGLVAIVGPAGDLAKSVLKREAGVKDTGALFPGHGGIMDRFDSLLPALPPIYGLLRLALERAA